MSITSGGRRSGLGRSAGSRRGLLESVATLVCVCSGLAAAPVAAQQPSAAVELTVKNQQNYPLASATVRFDEQPLARFTDEAGRLRVTGLAPGTRTIHVQVLGYAPASVSFDAVAGRTHEVTMVLQEEPLVIGGVEVEVRPSPDQMDFMRGFYERKSKGFGYFLTREEIEERGSTDLSNLLRTVPGIRAEPTQFGQARIQTSRTPAGSRCRIGVFVDRVRYRLADDLPGISTKDIEAIEVYRGRSELPGEFADPDLNCGVIVIWSRRHQHPR